VVGKIGGLEEGGDQNGIIDQTKCRERERKEFNRKIVKLLSVDHGE